MPNLLSLYRQNREYILFALFIWAVLLMRTGYSFGDGDQIEVLPLVKKLHQTELYKNDLFIAEKTATPLNERFAIVHLLSLFYPYLEIACLLFHLLCTIALVMAFVKINEIFITKKWLNYLAVFTGIILLLNRFPGGAGFIGSLLEADNFGYAIGAWGVYMALKNKLYWSVALFLMATFFHPLAGFCIAILVWNSILIKLFLDKERQQSWKILLPAIIYLLPACIYIVLLARDNSTALSSEQYYRILFVLRNPHHLLPQAFPIMDLLIMAVLLCFGLWYFRKQSIFFYYLLLVQLGGFVFYTIAVLGFHSVTIGNSHWFRSSPWTEMFCLMALFAYLDKKISKDWNTRFFAWAFGAVFSVTCIVILFMPGRFPFHKSCEFHRGKYQNEEILFAEAVKDNELNGTFILPFSMTAFKYYAEQSSYVDFKTCPRKKDFVKTWYERIHRVYGIDANNIGGFALTDKADKYYAHIPEDSLRVIANEGVDYMVINEPRNSKYLKPAMHYKDYYVYKLQAGR